MLKNTSSLVFMFAVLLSLTRFAPAQTSVWPMEGHDPQKTSLSAFTGSQYLSSGPVWTFATNSSIAGGILISQEGKLYFSTSYSSLLYALNPDGTQYAAPVAGTQSGNLLVNDQLGHVYLAAQTGNGFNLWQYNKDLTNGTFLMYFNNGFAPSPLILGPNNTIVFFWGYVGSGLYVVDSSGRITGSAACPYPNFFVGSPTIATDESMYGMCPSNVDAADGGLYKFSSTGASLAFARYFNNATEPIIDHSGILHAGAYDLNLGGYSSWKNDLALGSAQPSDYTVSRAALLPDGVSTVKLSSSLNTNLNVLSARGTYNWDLSSATLPSAQSFSSVPTVDAQGKIYITSGSYIFCVNSVDGTILSSYMNTVGDKFVTQPVISNDGSVYVGATAAVYAFRPAGIAVITNVALAPISVASSTGSQTYAGVGQLFVTDAPPGTYTVTYGAVNGYTTPPPETKTSTVGGAISFRGTYQQIVSLPTLALSPSSLTFTYQQHTTTPVPTQPLSVSSTGSALSFTIYTSTNPPGGSWLSASQTAALTLGTVNVGVAANLPPGTYRGNVVVAATGALNSPQDVPITLIVTSLPSRFLAFPLKDIKPNTDAHLSSSTAPVNSVFDHSMRNSKGQYQLYTCDGSVVTFSGVAAAATPSSSNCAQRGYSVDALTNPPKSIQVSGINYVGAGTPWFLFYEGHAGIDYRAAPLTQVYAAASGTVRYPRAIIGARDAYRFNVLEVDPTDHPEYKLYYLHMTTHIMADPMVGTDPDPLPGCPSQVQFPIPDGAPVSAGCLIGLSGSAGVRRSPHLHFEVQKRVPSSSAPTVTGVRSYAACSEPRDAGYDCIPVDPYGWAGQQTQCKVATGETVVGDPYQCTTGVMNVPLWKVQ